MKTVNKKILPEYFSEVLKGTKTFELRKDEDEIQVGDIIVLNEWNGDFTGERFPKRSHMYHVINHCMGCRKGTV